MKAHNKLVRDKIQEVIAATGETASTRILNDDDYFTELVKKLGEEYAEFKEALSVEELADIQEVVLALADTIATREELEKVRMAKLAQRGGFKKKIFLEKTE